MVKVYIRKGFYGPQDSVVFVVSDKEALEFENKAMKITNEELLQIIEAIKISEYNKKPSLVENHGYYLKMAIDDLFRDNTKSIKEIVDKYKKGGSLISENDTNR